MGDELRWAARYQFLEELWRERDRIVFDPQLEQALHAGGEGSPAELLARLVPQAEPDARAWMVLANDRRAASFARQHAGTVFVGLDGAAELATDEAWQVALVTLPALGEGGRESLAPELLALLDVLGEKAGEDPERSVVLALACEPSESDATYERLADLVEELFGDARIYGLARPAMAAAFDFGRLFEDEEPDDEADVAIEVDTTLGSDPAFILYLAVIGDRLPAEGLTFIELPSEPSGGESRSTGASGSEGAELGAMRAQLSESQRRGDLQAIERLSLLEKLEQAEEELARLRGGEPAPARSDTAEPNERLDAVLARERALRWENERLRGELDNLRARPVEALEAELAELRARLAEAEAELEALDEELEEAAVEDAIAEESEAEADVLDDTAGKPEVAFEIVVSESESQGRQRKLLRGRLDTLIARLERGAELPALELHRELAAIRRVLR